ncbi:MAG TPA: PhoH family protein, partial [candidate division Zixibacteria bacterium]|nr:PhoH family protein [candidate division Zixibacteria bacterium]
MSRKTSKITATGEPLVIDISSVDQRKLFGPGNVFATEIELRFPVKLVARGDQLKIYGDVPFSEQVRDIFDQMIDHLEGGGILTEQSLEYAIRMVKQDEKPIIESSSDDRIILTNRHQAIRPRSDGQRKYIDAINANDLVFAIGPAGTGKTFLAVACAVRALKERMIDRIILVRPAVEADESLGFLPGDLKEKVDPYLRPLYDALYDMIPMQRMDKYLDEGIIEVAPLAYMRGRTLNNSFIILDEAQNTTIRQMKMFLTRLGINSKAVVTGDITQIDLPTKKGSGLVQVKNVLEGIDGIEFAYLDDKDVVRHRLVQD